MDDAASPPALTQGDIDQRVFDLYDEYCHGRLDRRGFLQRAAAVTLDRIAVGGPTERAVPALEAQPGQLKNNLLGMSFLNRLQSWEVRGDSLRMRGSP